MKLTINTSSSTLTSSQHLIILTDAENLEQPATGYQFNELKALIDATQFKG
ncbi:MAG TPA: leucyl aminopeptidase, partial [Acinetobacter radioresistens]|nr:leucyl aminopeptidase [Acinetobacter radioresistens]